MQHPTATAPDNNNTPVGSAGSGGGDSPGESWTPPIFDAEDYVEETPTDTGAPRDMYPGAPPNMYPQETPYSDHTPQQQKTPGTSESTTNPQRVLDMDSLAGALNSPS
jgi:hypothetical protein